MSNASQAILEFAPDRSTAGFRLHTFSVLNWGTFHNRIHTFRPDGRTSLLSGPNGAGKSTLADAVLTILIDSRKRNYNQASAGGGERKQRKERTERDYILGTYSEKHDNDHGYRRAQQLRKPGQSVTVLLAHFHNETFNSHVTLAQVLWVNSANKVDRAYIVARRKLSIEDDLSDLGSPAEVRQRLRDRGLEPIEGFSAYSQRFHEALCLMAAMSPMDIFNQAVCIKDITDLTSFIRRYMLDDGGAPQKLEQLRANFDELRLTYERIEREKRRLDKLNVIRINHEAVEREDAMIEEWQTVLDATPLYFAQRELELRAGEADRLQTALTLARAEKTSADIEEQKQQDRIQTLDREIQSSDEGRRLQQIEAECQRLTRAIEEIRPRHRRFHEALSRWGRGAAPASHGDFANLLREAEMDLGRLQTEADTAASRIIERKGRLADNQREQERISLEIRSLLQRKGNIDDPHIQRRQRIAQALKVPVERLPFVGELVQVGEAHAAWTGAIERLARNFAMSILVPADLRKAMDAHVHATHQRGLLVYHVVEAGERRPNANLRHDAVAGKLEIHPEAGEFANWLEVELSHRFDHRCCELPDEEFHQAHAAITINGLIRQRGSERRKDDRRDLSDTTAYVLGWDNTAKIRALEESQKKLQAEETALERDLEGLRKHAGKVAEQIHAAQSLPQIASAWQEIDYATPAAEVDNLRIEEKSLRKGSDRLQALQVALAAARKAKSEARARADAALRKTSGLESEAETNARRIAQCQEIVDTAHQDAQRGAALQNQFPAIKRMAEFPPSSIGEVAHVQQSVLAEAQRRRSKAFAARNDAISRVKIEMNRFLDEVKSEEPRLHDELYSEDLNVAGYNAALYSPFDKLRARIEEDDLPKNQQRFNRLLQSNLIEDVASFDGLLTDHKEMILRRIKELNAHLKEVDFDRTRGTYIQLRPMQTSDEQQKWFRTLRSYALENSMRMESSDEDRHETFQRVSHLLDGLAQDEKRTQRVIDVRNWFEFRADEIIRAGDVYHQSYSGASGKSGGEKNRLASTILATAIAFQYGISLDDERQSETFRLVVVDEMFSKTDDEFSTYLLELFKRFHLQLIIIQPLDSKIHLVQKYVERYHIVTRQDEYSSVHNLSVHEYAQLQAQTAQS